MKSKKAVVVLMMLVIATQFFFGADWAGETFTRWYHSYFADFIIPFAFYMLLILMEDQYQALQKWYVKSGAVFLLCSVSEILQYFGIYALASVFDPVDFIMYALGAVSAAFVDRKIFKNLFYFWG
jgi:hypothetical protein